MIRKRAGVLISGRGSNMRALVEAARDLQYPAQIVCVVSNKADAAGLAFAIERGIETKVVDHRAFVSREAFDAALNAYLQDQKLDLICCAGFMRIMTPVLIRPWLGRMLNIHPSLLPAYKGLHTHERALADGAKSHGCTVHFVTDELDSGQIVAQAAVSVLPGDTAGTLAARVLEQEHPLYAKALALVASGEIQMRTSS
ncbi:MAG: phosphoribosylglycinamide formyltransferase [Rhizobiales bacterium]|nr:phosphoribosylglycinamide formyltransferase [Hyphomicrobiales bacterium]